MRRIRNWFCAFGSNRNSFLTGKITADTKFDSETDLRAVFPRFTPEAIRANMPVVELLAKIAKRKNTAPVQIALTWLLAQKPFIIPIPGMDKIEYLDENIRSVAIELSEKDLLEIENGLLSIKFQWKKLMVLFFNIVAIPKINIKQMMNQDNNDRSEILAITRQLTESMIKKDTISINNIVDSNFTLTHITSYIQTKSEWFSEIESERMRYYSYEKVKTTVNIDGHKATFIGQNLLDARIWDSRNKWRLQQIMELEKREGKWIILKSVAKTF